jgi:hypothetical protein
MASRSFVAFALLGALTLAYGCGSSDSGGAGGAGTSAAVGGMGPAGTGGSTSSGAGGSGAVSGGATSDAGAAGEPDSLLGPMPCSDETELGAPTPSSGARSVTTGGPSPGKTAVSVGFSGTDVTPGSNAVLWALYSGATAFRTFGSVSPQSTPGQAGFGDGVTSAATFTAKAKALADAPESSNLVSWSTIETAIVNGKAAGVLPLAAAIGAPLVVEIKTRADTIPLVDPPTTAADWNSAWEVWKNYFAVSFVYARDYGITRFEIYNEPDLHTSPSDAFSSLPDYNARARLAGDAIQRGVAAANVARLAENANAAALVPLVPLVIAPTSATSSYSWGQELVAERNDGPLGTAVPNYTLFQGYGYHSYNSDGAGSEATIQKIQTNVLEPQGLTLPWFITEFNAYDNSGSQMAYGNQAYAADMPDFSRRLVEKAIGYAESNVGPMNLYAFSFLSTIDDTKSPPATTNNGLYWSTADSVIGGDSMAGAAYRLLIKHFGEARDRIGLTVSSVTAVDAGKAPDTLCEATYDERYDADYILCSNRAAATQKVFFNLASFALPSGSVATVIDVDALHHGEITHRVTLSSASTFEITQQANAVTLVSVPRKSGGIASVGAIADTTLAPGSQSGTRFGGDMTLQLAADSTNTSRLRTALLAFELPDTKGQTIGEGVLELSLAPGAPASTGEDVIHVYGVLDTAWTDDPQTGERWSDLVNLRSLADGSKYAAIEDNAIQYALKGVLDPDLRIAGTALASNGLLRVDVTDYLREQAASGHGRVSLLLVREVNRHAETITYSAAFRARESSCGGPSLTLRMFK